MGNLLKYLLAAIVCCGSAFHAAGVRAEFPPAACESAAIPSDLGLTVSDENLGGQTGGQDAAIDQMNVRISDVKTNAQMESSVLSATNSTLNNGANTISQNSFANAAGLVTVIQNSGNQVLIQNDMVLNLFMK